MNAASTTYLGESPSPLGSQVSAIYLQFFTLGHTVGYGGLLMLVAAVSREKPHRYVSCPLQMHHKISPRIASHFMWCQEIVAENIYAKLTV